MNPPLTAVELFAGAGGLALGTERAAFDHAALFERDREACGTLRLNRPGWNVVEGDVQDLDFHEYDGADLVAGGPPCQDFSMAGDRRLDQGDRNMFPEAIRAVREVRPRAVVLENVTGLAKGDARDYLGWVIRQLSALGYGVRWRVLNAADHGVPQTRERVFIVGFRLDVGARWEWPAPAWPRPTVREARRGLEADPEPDYERDPGGGFTRIHDLDAPAGTVTTFPTTTWLRLDDGNKRLMSIRHLARLQSFPDAWQFVGGDDRTRLKQIGNAVPVNLARALAGAVARALGDPPRL